jgi:hypothetical protein
LCLATREIDNDGFAPVAKSARLEAGKHLIALEQQQGNPGWRIAVAWDGEDLLAVEEPKEWYPGFCSTGGGGFGQCTQLAADQPVVLFRRRFLGRDGTGASASSGPTEGILLWIEPVAGSNVGP